MKRRDISSASWQPVPGPMLPPLLSHTYSLSSTDAAVKKHYICILLSIQNTSQRLICKKAVNMVAHARIAAKMAAHMAANSAHRSNRHGSKQQTQKKQQIWHFTYEEATKGEAMDMALNRERSSRDDGKQTEKKQTWHHTERIIKKRRKRHGNKVNKCLIDYPVAAALAVPLVCEGTNSVARAAGEVARDFEIVLRWLRRAIYFFEVNQMFCTPTRKMFGCGAAHD